MYKRVKLLHNIDELEQHEEVELQLEDQLILENGKLNEKDDVLYNRDMKQKLIRDFHRKQQMFEEVGRLGLGKKGLSNRQNGLGVNREMLGKYNDLDFSKRGVYLDYDKDGNLRNEREVSAVGDQSKSFGRC